MQKAFTLPEVHTLVEYFNKSRFDFAKLEEKQKLLGLPNHKLIQAVPHPWNSVYDMIEQLCEQQPAVAAVLHFIITGTCFI